MFSSINLEPFHVLPPSISRHFEFHFFFHASLVFNQPSSFLLFPYFRWLRFKFRFEASAEQYNEQRMNLTKRHNKEFFQVVFRPVTKAEKPWKKIWSLPGDLRNKNFVKTSFRWPIFQLPFLIKISIKIRNSLGAKITTIKYFCSNLNHQSSIFLFPFHSLKLTTAKKKQSRVWTWRSIFTKISHDSAERKKVRKHDWISEIFCLKKRKGKWLMVFSVQKQLTLKMKGNLQEIPFNEISLNSFAISINTCYFCSMKNLKEFQPS